VHLGLFALGVIDGHGAKLGVGRPAAAASRQERYEGENENPLCRPSTPEGE
jgi:hypothetical protein